MLQHPIYAIIVAVLITVLVIIESLNKGIIFKTLLGFSFLNLTLWVLMLFFYEQIINDDSLKYVYIAYSFINFGLFLILVLYLMRKTNNRNQHYLTFLKAIKNSRWNTYLVVDQKEKIVDVSQALLDEMALTKEEVLGKKLFDVLQKTVRIKSRNGTTLNNQNLKDVYTQYAKNVRPNEIMTEEIGFNNADGQLVYLKLITQPIFSHQKYKGRMSIGEKRTDLDLLEVERTLKRTDNNLEGIKSKFSALLELIPEGLIFINLDQETIWLNDILKEELALGRNDLSYADYLSLIEPSDLNAYQAVITQLKPDSAHYNATYRLNINNKQVWLKESGVKVFDEGTSNTIISTISAINGRQFRKIGYEIIDNIKDENHLLTDVEQLLKHKKRFVLAIIKFTNLEALNHQVGRQIGNLALAKYIEKFYNILISESADIYRLSGLEFAFTITDQRKMNVLYSKDANLSEKMTFGEYNIKLEAVCGVSSDQDNIKDAKDLILKAYRALNVSLHANGKQNISHFKDII